MTAKPIDRLREHLVDHVSVHDSFGRYLRVGTVEGLDPGPGRLCLGNFVIHRTDIARRSRPFQSRGLAILASELLKGVGSPTGPAAPDASAGPECVESLSTTIKGNADWGVFPDRQL